jgi:stage VI sporulation protein D
VTADHQTSLRFSLKESVWFQKGQEVAELLSISLDPDIVIQERDYEVVVKGELQLTGEYIAEQVENASFSLRELSPVRTVDSVYTREDGINELTHHFPLEVSIPRSRVKEINDLYVTIESFDYEIPERDCLQLIADISIGGLCEEVREVEEEEELQDISEQEDYYNPPVLSRAEPEELEDSEEPEEDIFEPFQLEVRKQSIDEEIQEEKEEQEHIVPQIELFSRVEAVIEEEGTAERQEEFEYSNRDENALYLTKLFTKERDDEFTKMRMYFVQEGDTIDSIAERYDITVQQLTRINNLDDIYVSEGKILYIPVTKPKTTS